MQQVDLKDRKILYQLDLNCRQSNSQIGKKVGLSKQVVDYRIKKMEVEEIIKGYWTAINTYKLGFYVFRIYINFIDVSSEIKKEIIDYFIKNKDAWAILTSKGPVDLDIVLWINDIYKFNQYWLNTLDKYGRYFTKNTVSILTAVISCRKSYLLDKDEDLENRLFYRTNCKGFPININKLDYKILDLLALNGRISLIELAQKLNCSSQTINYRIKNLIETDIIQAFRVNIDTSKIGLQGCSVDLYLKEQSKRYQLIEFLIKNPNIFDIMDMNVGWSDLSFQILISEMNSLTELIDDIEKVFPNSIRRYDYWMSQVVHKERWLPDISKIKFK